MTNVLTAFSCQRTFAIFYLLNSDITRGVVHNYAFSCIHRHIGCRQRKCAWNLDGAHAVVVNAEPLLPYTVDLFCIKNVKTCKELRPLVQEYQRSADEKQFRRKHEGALILYEAAAKVLKNQGLQKLPDLYALKAEYKQLAKQKDQLQRQYNDAKRQMQEYGIIKQNVDSILRTTPGKEQMQER